MKTVLTIAGSDSGGGAGVQADLKTFAALGVYGTSAFTALTAQNTQGVAGVHLVPAEFVTLQIETVVSDLGCDAVKTGMLASAAIVEAVAAAVESLELPNLVVDPVMVAKSGDRLLDNDAAHAVRTSLVRLARVVTPNVPEAEELTGMKITTLEDMRTAAKTLAELGPGAVIVKGGHRPSSDVIDVLYDGRDLVELSAPRIEGRSTHGTGCTFSAALAAHLALGTTVVEAAQRAKAYVSNAMRRGIPLGHGHRPLDHFFG
ncbi:MAG: bifunctional hydroxymethylpyrimidine kinase/phosphomethylpyrimidine kinase [Vicinamibacterales bacterium]